jgi:hypothetical protein
VRIGKLCLSIAATVVALLLVCVTGPRGCAVELQASSQSQAPATSSAAAVAPAANPADVSSIDAILHAAYDTISGPAGRQRDWDRFRSLFVSGARLAAVVPNHQEGFRTVVLSPEEYIQHDDPYFQSHGFFEREVARRTERFAGIAQVFSTYESRHAAAAAKPFERGINSFQLMNDGRRWWIVTIFWQGETPERPIPQEFLQGVK